MNSISTAGLIRHIISGNADAARVFVLRFSSTVYALCLAILANPHDAEEAAQDAMYKCIRNINDLHSVDSLRSWISSIARNTSLDLLRKRKVNIPLEREPEVDSQSQEQQLLVKEALALLPAEFREPLLLFYFDGQSARSVGEALDISESAAYARLSRGRKKLRVILQDISKGGRHDV